jgi:hypothetical protein
MMFLSTLLPTFFFFIPGVRSQSAPTSRGPLVVQVSENRVSVNTATGIYHYPGTRWYGNTNRGEFMSEAEAQAKGYRAAKNGQAED